jgi:hypothetical protein
MIVKSLYDKLLRQPKDYGISSLTWKWRVFGYLVQVPPIMVTLGLTTICSLSTKEISETSPPKHAYPTWENQSHFED